MNKIFGIIGAICFAIAVGIGYFLDFEGDVVVQVAFSAFGLAFIVINAIKKAKEEGKYSWKFILCIVLAVIGGILCAIGGLADSIFATLSGAVIALLAIIFGIVKSIKK